ncbi:MAG: Holliday junction resolvase RuvX [Legionellales bacterium]|nr:Holliday junction resolvase RuvX [Legionellales bacterium]|tara:strand:+ start:83 stop:553 length:471 start_codon:yes stop_codon:yes gene_type:complete
MLNDQNLIEIDPNQSYNGRLLGFDFGEKSIGVAVGQTVTKSAKPLTTIKALQGIPNNWQDVDTVITNWKPSALIIGIPLHMDGSPQFVTTLARDFALQLKQRYNLPVHGIDERLTTKDAKAQLFERGGYKALTKQNIDALSAVLILESWINQYCED